jgi:hypothetical protein
MPIVPGKTPAMPERHADVTSGDDPPKAGEPEQSTAT